MIVIRQAVCFDERNAAAIKQTVTTIEKMSGVVKTYLQLSRVMAIKAMAKAHAVLRMRTRLSGGRPANCHARTAANKRNTVKRKPKALKKSQ